MESAIQPNAQEPSREKAKKAKKDRVTWWQSLIILAVTLAICLSAGYYVSDKYLWNKKDAQLDKQLTFYKEQVDEKPNDPKLRIQLGYTYYLKGDDSAAIKQYQTAKSLDKNYFDAYLNLSIVYDKEKRIDDALQMAIKAVKISPRDYKGHLLKGRSYRKLKMYDKATEALQEAYRLKNGNTDVIYEAGLVAEAQGKKKEAEQLFKESLSFDPTYKPALNALDRLNSKNK
ncbi:tetratricopeptide repeat protein [Bacillus sp. USDA818B3_A]|uniref:tetratricopeptide repeat protein n=1 Tax=Bacillus sp. USDA818B3_A TaxID=2698834 RepID=UPI0013704651|nr:tetratricopeptide repeat protein [Bacillus sp. USDA818B3_A]